MKVVLTLSFLRTLSRLKIAYWAERSYNGHSSAIFNESADQGWIYVGDVNETRPDAKYPGHRWVIWT